MRNSLSIAALCGLLIASADARARPGKCEYVVEDGDLLSRIANKVGLTQAELLAENAELAKDPDKLRIGQTLDVCVDTTADKSSARGYSAKRCGKGGRLVQHEIDSGDTLSKIAKRYAVDEAAIVARNASLKKDPNLLVVGHELEVCADEQASAAPKSKICGYRTPLHEHEVVPGEHLGTIAGRYGVQQRDLQKWNSALRSNANLLRVGQTIRVCPEIAPHERTELDYTVAAGDSFGEIAVRYGLTTRELLRYQRGGFDDPSKLRVGQTLRVWVEGSVLPGFGGLEDDKGVLAGGVQLPDGKHYHVKWKAAAWGTSHAVKAIQTAVADYKRRMPGGPAVHIGDISRRGGGEFPPHVSHQHGRDVDIGYVLKGDLANETRFRTAKKSNLDVGRTWRLLKSLVDTGEVNHVFMSYDLQGLVYEYAKDKGVSEDTLDELFQYPRGRGRTHGMIRHWKGHVNHFHVRFRR